jgi:hypothetical protein
VTNEVQEKYIGKGISGFDGNKIATKILPAGECVVSETFGVISDLDFLFYF